MSLLNRKIARFIIIFYLLKLNLVVAMDEPQSPHRTRSAMSNLSSRNAAHRHRQKVEEPLIPSSITNDTTLKNTFKVAVIMAPDWNFDENKVLQNTDAVDSSKYRFNKVASKQTHMTNCLPAATRILETCAATTRAPIRITCPKRKNKQNKKENKDKQRVTMQLRLSIINNMKKEALQILKYLENMEIDILKSFESTRCKGQKKLKIKIKSKGLVDAQKTKQKADEKCNSNVKYKIKKRLEKPQTGKLFYFGISPPGEHESAVDETAAQAEERKLQKKVREELLKLAQAEEQKLELEVRQEDLKATALESDPTTDQLQEQKVQPPAEQIIRLLSTGSSVTPPPHAVNIPPYEVIEYSATKDTALKTASPLNHQANLSDYSSNEVVLDNSPAPTDIVGYKWLRTKLLINSSKPPGRRRWINKPNVLRVLLRANALRSMPNATITNFRP